MLNANNLYHISEQPDISLFYPRPSPSYFADIKSDVVFAIGPALLHNYLLPRDCPRVTYYPTPDTTIADRQKFMGESTAGHVIVVEAGWYERIKQTTLFCYEFTPENFSLLDECAGYYISYQPVKPIAIHRIDDILGELLSRNIELRFTPSLTSIAESVKASSLNFSLIRMRNARQ